MGSTSATCELRIQAMQKTKLCGSVGILSGAVKLANKWAWLVQQAWCRRRVRRELGEGTVVVCAAGDPRAWEGVSRRGLGYADCEGDARKGRGLVWWGEG